MIFEWSRRVRSRPALGWALALGSFVLALAIRFAVDPFLPPGFPFLTFFPAVMMTAFLAGTRPGILCGILSTLAAWYWFIAPVNMFALGVPGTVALVFFVSVIAIDLFIIDTMHRALDDQRRERAKAERLADERRTLFQELQHRIANNLAFVSSLLSMHKRRHAARPEVAEALDDARLRLETLSSVHRRLYDPAAKDRPLSAQLQGICDDLVKGSGLTGVACRVSADDLPMSLDRTMTLSLVTIEIVSNSLKHAFRGRDGGRIDVSLRQTEDGSAELRIADDGPGLAEGVVQATDRLGMRIVSGFARQLGGELHQSNEGGAVTRLTFPIA